MSGQELRKIMNLMESVAISESKTYNIVFTDYNDGEDTLISFASQEDAEIYSAVEAGMDEGSIYSGMESTEYVDEVAEKIVPAGFLAEFAEAAFAEEFDDDVYYEVMDKLEGFFQPYSRPEDLEEASTIHGMDLDALLWQIFEYGGKYRTVSPNGGVFNKAKELIERLLDIYGPSVPRKEIAGYPSMSESTVMETGNANAQQKGINFKGTPAVKNKGDINLSSPKSKPTGGKTPLAQQKAGTNVGKIKS